MKFTVANCAGMLEEDFGKEIFEFTKKNGRAADAVERRGLKLLIGFESAERYVRILEESAAIAATKSLVPTPAPTVSIIRAQWNLCLNAAARENITVEENAHHLMNFVDYVNWVSGDESAMFQALRNFLLT